LKKFVLVTRGRTGSTAIIDELDKSTQLCTAGELFRKGPFNERVLKRFSLIKPFDMWNKGNWLKQLVKFYCSDTRRAHIYLTHAESLAQVKGAGGFGWKLLSHQLDERPFLQNLLKQKNYRAIYLRRNNVRQVLSGMVASKRGIWNSVEKIDDDQVHYIDVKEFKWLVQWERECVKNDLIRLAAEGFDFIEVSYEGFCSDRQSFYNDIFNFLGLTPELPSPSNFVKMIDDLRLVIENYDEVVAAATGLGEML